MSAEINEVKREITEAGEAIGALPATEIEDTLAGLSFDEVLGMVSVASSGLAKLIAVVRAQEPNLDAISHAAAKQKEKIEAALRGTNNADGINLLMASEGLQSRTAVLNSRHGPVTVIDALTGAIDTLMAAHEQITQARELRDGHVVAVHTIGEYQASIVRLADEYTGQAQ